MGEFNSDDHWNYYCGQECLRRNGVAIRVNKRVQNAVLGCNCKNDRMISVRCMVLWRPTRQSRTNTQKRCPFYYRGLECKSRKSRSSWCNRQFWPWSTEWSRAKANRLLTRERTGHNKHPLPTTQEKTLTHGNHQMVNTEIRLIIFFAAKDGEALYSQQKQDQELTLAQIMNSLLPNSDLNWGK